jgi:hypothetical protein
MTERSQLDQAAEYLSWALDARKVAASATDATLKEGFLRIAEQYELMAAKLSLSAK